MHVITSIIYFNDLCKPIEIYVYARGKHALTSFPAAKHQKHSKFAITDMQEKAMDFIYCTTQTLTLTLAVILLTRVPLQKFQFLFSL